MNADDDLDTSYEYTARFYDDFKLYAEREDVNFYVEMAIKSGGPVLELGCGTGRVLIPTAREGVEIIGLDNSPGMLRVCETNLSEEEEEVQDRVELLRGDMKEINLGRKFNLITTPFRSFQHILTVEDQIETLGRIREHLTDEGRFILDVFNPDINFMVNEEIGKEVFNGDFELPDGTKVERYHKAGENNLLNQVKTVQFIYRVLYADGKKEDLVEEFDMRYLYRYETEHLLVRCGFEIEAIYSDYNYTPYGEKYPGELVFVAKRGE